MLVDHKTVIAHVYAHCDFFKNNIWFSKTNRKMMDGMANHATRVRRYIERHGLEPVEQFIDTVLALENLIDPHSVFMRRQPPPPRPQQGEPKKEERVEVRPLPRQGLHGPLYQPAAATGGRGKRGTAEECPGQAVLPR